MKALRDIQGVVLSSGGADGAYAVGVMKALFHGRSPVTGYAPLRPAIFVGTSIGAFNSSFMVSRAGIGMPSAVDELERVWLDEMAQNSRQQCGNGTYRFRANPLRFLNPRCISSGLAETFAALAEDSAFLTQDLFQRAGDFLRSNERLEERAVRLINFSSFVSSMPLMQLIERRISFENIRRSQLALRVIATNWDRGEVETFQNENFTDALGAQIIRASAAVPGFFPRVEFNGHTYVDGAVLGYTRLAPAIEFGASTLHVIYVDPDVENIPLEALESTLETLYRVFVIGWAATVNTSIQAVKRVNRYLEIIEAMALKAHLSEEDLKPLLQTLIPSERGPGDLIKITLHRYHPRDDLFGPLGLLNLDRDRLQGLIERGYNDAVTHDCVRSKCVVPATARQAEAAA